MRNEITLNLYVRKVQHQTRGCNACNAFKNMDAHKRQEHVEYMTGSRIPAEKIKWKDLTLLERLTESEVAFQAEDTEFQTSYFKIHLSSDELNRIRPKLLSVGNGKLTMSELNAWEYIPYYRIGNQTKYTPMLFHRASSSIEKPAYVQWRCEVCESTFVNRDLEVQKNRLKILCIDCGFCNKTFKVRSMSTPWDGAHKIRYQSIQEKRCIEWCIENGIRILNGPSIPYKGNEEKEKEHIYKVDFQIPALNALVEIKDNHIWHTKQIQSGKWAKKEEAARRWCAEHGWTYEMVFPKTLSKWKEETLVRYSLTLQETVRSKDKEPCDNNGGNL